MAHLGFRAAKRRYHRTFWPLMAIYVLAVLGGSWMVNQYDEPSLWMNVAAALASALPIIAVLLVILRYFEETDEYTRLRQLKAFAYGAVIAVSAIFLVGFLQLFDVFGGIEVFWFGPLFLLAWGLSYCRVCLPGKTV